MSDLRPTGEKIVVDGVERRLLFTLNAIDELQEQCKMPLDEIVNLLTDKEKSGKALRKILMVLLNDEADRMEHNRKETEKLRRYDEKEIGWIITRDNVIELTIAVLKAYGLSLPEGDEFETPKAQSGQTR